MGARVKKVLKFIQKMCGINGFISFDKKLDKSSIRKMNLAIKHRGPDDSGTNLISKNKYNIGLGHVRLSIIDLTKNGRQPMIVKNNKTLLNRTNSHPGDYYITFNGEIYNFKEIRSELINLNYTFETNTDTEVLIKGYEAWGTKVLEKVIGMFSFVIYDKKKKILFGARDRFGKKPLKYYISETSFIFSSELKAILKCNIPRTVDESAIYDFLTYQYVPSPKTGFKEIHKLPNGHYFLYNIEKKKIKLSKYSEFSYSKKNYISHKKLIKSIDRSVKQRMVGDVEVGAFLSGGIDSSLVAKLASKYKKNLKTFTIKFKEAKYDESRIAKKFAKENNFDYHEFTVTPNELLKVIKEIVNLYEEPYGDPSQIPTYILSKKASEHVKVVLTGDGGDEIFGGYSKYQIHLYANLFYPLRLPIQIILSTASRIFRRNNTLKKLNTFIKSLKFNHKERHINFTNYFDFSAKKKLIRKSIVNKNSRYKKYSLDDVFQFDLNSYLPDDLMVKVDLASMAHGLEARSPLLDKNLTKVSMQIKPSLKTTLTDKKIILKKALKNILPKYILSKRKQGFSIPIDFWIRYKLRSEIKKTIFSREGIVLKLFNKKEVKNLLFEHLHGVSNGKKLWLLYVLNIWHKEYFLRK